MPPTRQRSSVERYHDRVAGLYDTIYDGDPYWEALFEITWRHMARHLPRDLATRCLDVGCGTGRWGLRLAKSGYRVDFLDISQKMLDQAATKIARLGRGVRHHEAMTPGGAPPAPPGGESVFWHASLDDLAALPSGAYGFIVGQGDPLNCATRPERAFKELARLLAPGGAMVMSVDNRLQGLYHYFKAGDVAGLKDFLKTGRTRWVTDDPEEQYPMVMFTPGQIRKMCAARGLALVSLIGKTVLPLRRFKALLEDPEQRAELMRLEESLHALPELFANAAHLEFAARKAASAE
jgi:ubiquinone/menaquinone biosynthesis C-methylase UbiE